MLVHQKKINLRSWVSWFLAVLFYFYEFMIQVSPGVMANDLMKTFNISGLSLGNLSAYYFYSYALMQLVTGLILDRLGPRKLIATSSIVCAIGCFLFSKSATIQHAEICRIIIGMGSACAVVSAFKIAAQWFEKKMFGIMAGMTVTVGMMGAICGEVPLAWLVDTIGWRQMMELFAVVGIIISIIVYVTVRDAPIPHNIIKNKAPFFHSLKEVLSCKQTWFTSIYGGLMFAPTTALGSLWGVSWMCAYYGFDRTQATQIISFLFLGWVVGSPLSGMLTNYFGKCKTTMHYGSILTLVVILMLIFIQTWAPLSLAILWFFLGFASSGFLPFMSIIKNLHADYNAGTAMSFGNAMNMAGGAFLQPFIGFILDCLWDGTVVDGVRIYTASNFTYALLILPFLTLTSLYILSRIKENYMYSHTAEDKMNPTNDVVYT
ncbi:MFS transporter [Candidatus Paracaedibacter symbiosus]|uniref:MFS transporter n=1 Tax=Candidatus Paracaedibacter symbiosus TaxID=244582 RepID=UPI0006924B30|nr:MFS transporter [Candidatus Paracaedibacter symbiosus]